MLRLRLLVGAGDIAVMLGLSAITRSCASVSAGGLAIGGSGRERRVGTSSFDRTWWIVSILRLLGATIARDRRGVSLITVNIAQRGAHVSFVAGLAAVRSSLRFGHRCGAASCRAASRFLYSSGSISP